MLRRILAFVVFIVLIGAVSSLVYFNAQETSFRLAPDRTFTLPLGVLMLAAALSGAAIMFVVALMREGRHALRDWRVHREIRSAERNAENVAQARSLTLAGDYKRARALLTKATQKRAPEIGDVIDYAETFLLADDPVQARRILEDGQKEFGNEPLLLFALARACRAGGDRAAAVSALERALSVYPNSMVILALLRDLLVENETWDRAADIQQRIVELEPDDGSEKNWLLGTRYEAAMLVSRDARDAALKRVSSEDADFVPALLDRARLLAKSGDPRRAIKLLEKSAKRRPRGAVLDELERLVPGEEATRVAKLYAKLIASNPANTPLRLRAARYLVTNGRAEEAADLLNAISENGNGPAVQAIWAAVHDARSDAQRAHLAYQRALATPELTAPEFSCEVCGTPSKHWHARCAHCGAWGLLESL